MKQLPDEHLRKLHVIRCHVLVILWFILATPLVVSAQDEPPIRFAWFLDFSPDGKSLVTSYGAWLPTEEGEVRVWDVTGRIRHVLTSPRGVRCAAWSAKGSYFASANYAGDVVLYHSQTGAKKLEVSTGNDNAEFVQITPDERYLIAASGNGQTWVWEIATGKMVHRMAHHSESIWGMRIAADSKTLATAGKDGLVSVSDIETGKQLFKLVHPRTTIGVAFTEDVRQLVTGSHDAQIRVWDLGTGKLTRTILGHRSSVNDFDFSPGDKLLASSGSDRTVRLWDFASGEMLAMLQGHEQTVYGVRFSPNGKLLASGSWDATIRLWDVENREELLTLPRKLEPLADASELRLAARKSFDDGDFDKAHQQLIELLDGARQQPGESVFEWSQLLGKVAHEYVCAGQLEEAMAILGEAADLNLPFQAGSDRGLAGAAAGLHRRLAGLDAEERYKLLHAWSMPTESRRTVRMLTTRTPTDAPPSVFARALGERPRRDSFPIADVGGVRGLFSTAWELVRAADESGHLRQLSSEAERLVEDSVPGSQVLAALAEIAAANRPGDELMQRLEQFTSNAGSALHSRGARGELVVAAACMKHESLWSVSQEIVDTFAEIQSSETLPAVLLLRRAYAHAVLHRGDPSNSTDLSDWIAATPVNGNSLGASKEVWLSHEDSLLRLADTRESWLLFRYPLVGDFTLSCEAITEGDDKPAAGVAYNGLTFGASGPAQTFNTWVVGHRHETRLAVPFLPNEQRPTAQRLVLNSANDAAMSVSVNGHPVWTGNARDATGPWIGLWSASGQTPVYRNVRITGVPTIPREVILSGDDELRCWSSGDLQETPPTATEGVNWYGKDGVICGTAEENRATVTPSRLSYLRPLQDGDSISYQFLHEPGRYDVHPALGRLAFLIEPDGVSVHWMTSSDVEWTGLANDNAVVEPLNRRGPKPLPLVAGNWHSVQLSLSNGKLSLSLDQAEIYARQLEPEDDRTFSFYHDRSRSAARVRNVVLRGDWPEKLSADQTADLARIDASNRSDSQRRVLGQLFDERHVADAAFRLHQQAAKMAAEERFEFLASWVLPGPDHETLRLALDFAPTNPAPPVLEDHPFDNADVEAAIAAGQHCIQTGGFPVAPALDLVTTAKELGRLDEVRSRIEQAPSETELQQRCRLAMLILTDIARLDFDSALSSLDDLHTRVKRRAYEDLAGRWPETLVIWTGIHHAETRQATRGLLSAMLQNQVRDGHSRGPEQWDRMVVALAGRLEYIDRLESSEESGGRFTAAPSLKHWSPISRTTAMTRGRGFPVTHWTSSPGSVEKLACHNDDYLMYRIPLRGEFEVECELAGFGWRDTQLCVADTWVAPLWDLTSYEFGSFRDARPPMKIDPPLSEVGDWNRYRVVVRDHLCTTYFNGRQLHEKPLHGEYHPWLAIRSPWNANSAVRSLCITGNPVIPAQVNLSVHQDLPGWTPYYNETVGGDWRFQTTGQSGGITGRRRGDLAGMGQESLLRYQRPMLEDGTIEYDFYYSRDKSHVHPSLDRRAFLLDLDGVRIHWVTDDAFDHTGLDPLNVFDEPESRRGPDKLPLKADEWNHMRVSLAGDTVALELNDHEIYRCELEPTNQRTFGLFHYSDRTEARVRNIVWQGDWPRELPTLDQQELARSPTEAIDEGLARLTARVHHEFAKDGLPLDRFRVHGAVPGEDWRRDVVVKPDGLHCRRQGIKGYSCYWIGAQMRVHGDFDITARLDKLIVERSEHGSGGLSLTAILENDGYTHGTVYRGALIDLIAPIKQVIQSEFVRSPMGQTRMTWLGTTSEEATAGTMRLARRGDKLHCLFAEHDSSRYRLVHTEEVGDESLLLEGVRLTVAVQASGNKPGSTAVIWKDLTVRAERITDWPDKIEQIPPQRNADE